MDFVLPPVPDNLFEEEEPPISHGWDAVVVDMRSEDTSLQVIPDDSVTPPFDIIFEVGIESNLVLNTMNVLDIVLRPDQSFFIRESPRGNMVKFIVPKLTVARFLYLVDWITLVKATWSLEWDQIGNSA